MGLNEVNNILSAFSGLINSGLNQTIKKPQITPQIDIISYFEQNTLKDSSKLSDDDLMTISQKTENGYKASFVRLGDLKKFILEKYKNELSGKIGLIMGEEIAAEFHKWYNVEFLAENCHLIISPRIKDYDEDENVSKNKPSGNFHGDFSTKFDKFSHQNHIKWVM